MINPHKKVILAQDRDRILLKIETMLRIRDRDYEVCYHEFWNNREKFNNNIRMEYPDRYSPPIIYCVQENNLTDKEALLLFNSV